MRTSRRFLLAFALCLATLVTFTPRSSAARVVTPPAQATGDLLDINTATADQLKALPGIGDAYAKRIIAGRPYTAKNQLVNRGVLPQAVYDKISARVIAKRPAK